MTVIVTRTKVGVAKSTTPYDMSGFSIGFSYSWPTAPTTTSTYNVTAGDGADLASAVQTANRKVVVPAGTYSTALTSWANDVDVVAADGANITAAININGFNRIRWTGGKQTLNSAGAAIQINNAEDVLFDNFVGEYTNTGSGAEGFALTNKMYRFALINSTIDWTAAGGNPWLLHTRTTGSPDYTDHIVANCRLDNTTGQGAAFRFNPYSKNIVVDTAVNVGSLADLGTGMRISDGNVGTSRYTHWENCINVGLIHTDFSDVVGGYDLNDAQWTNVHRYNPNSQNTLVGAATNMGAEGGTCTNCKVHTQGTPTSPGLDEMTDGGGNTSVSWDGSTIDYTDMPGKTSISDYGADH
jgi:hypothetical protein